MLNIIHSIASGEAKKLRIYISVLICTNVPLIWSFSVLKDRYDQKTVDFPSGLLDWFAVLGFGIFLLMFLFAVISFTVKKTVDPEKAE